jgi:hypothetical protein
MPALGFSKVFSERRTGNLALNNGFRPNEEAGRQNPRGGHNLMLPVFALGPTDLGRSFNILRALI